MYSTRSIHPNGIADSRGVTNSEQRVLTGPGGAYALRLVRVAVVLFTGVSLVYIL